MPENQAFESGLYPIEDRARTVSAAHYSIGMLFVELGATIVRGDLESEGRFQQSRQHQNARAHPPPPRPRADSGTSSRACAFSTRASRQYRRHRLLREWSDRLRHGERSARASTREGAGAGGATETVMGDGWRCRFSRSGPFYRVLSCSHFEQICQGQEHLARKVARFL